MKLKTGFCVIAALLLIGSSPWEGAAVIAPDGFLPAAGYYVATNSFPVNTVVDITNIETNKSTRVIVANTLDSPGLLAVVSKQAAELIGLRPDFVGRVRMVQPSDPIAYLRFTEGLAAGIPEYDSGNVLTEENYRDEIYRDDTYTNPPAAAQRPATPQPVREPQRVVTGPSYILEPEWRSRPEITDLYGYEILEPVEPFKTIELVEQPEPVYVEPEPVYFEETEFIAEAEPVYIEEEYVNYHDEIIKDIPEYITETPPEEIEKETSAKIDEESPREEVAKYIPEWEDTLIEEPVRTVETPPVEEQPELVIVPTEERPPENTIYGINPDDIIPPITQTPQQTVVTVVPEPAPVYNAGFSVPRISSLERGRYYVQIASLEEPESVETALVNPVVRSYSPVVYSNGDNKYRILLGPLNQGESAAILQRFKSIGYNDAFVRTGS